MLLFVKMWGSVRERIVCVGKKVGLGPCLEKVGV